MFVRNVLDDCKVYQKRQEHHRKHFEYKMDIVGIEGDGWDLEWVTVIESIDSVVGISCVAAIYTNLAWYDGEGDSKKKCEFDKWGHLDWNVLLM